MVRGAHANPSKIGGFGCRCYAGEAVVSLLILKAFAREMSGRDRVVLLLNLLGRKVRASVSLAGLAS
jgi:hypothetical protein